MHLVDIEDEAAMEEDLTTSKKDIEDKAAVKPRDTEPSDTTALELTEKEAELVC